MEASILKKINYRIICVILLCALAICIVLGFLLIHPSYKPSFIITGDVAEMLKINTMDGWETSTVYREGQALTGVSLSKLVEKAKPYTDKFKVVLKGDDGLIAEVDDMNGMSVTYTAQNAWECINAYHPPSSNIKRLEEVWVVSQEEISGVSVHVITPVKNIAAFTPGQFFMSAHQSAPVFEGQSVKETEKGKYSVAVYTLRNFRTIKEIENTAGELLVMGGEGQYQFDSAPGRLELSGNILDYVFSNGKTRMKNVKGVLIDPPTASNMDTYQESISNLNSGSRVLVFLVDGFGYHQYQYAKSNGFSPYIQTLPEAKQASTVYEPVTYAGTAAMLTGQPPYKNGVYKKGMSDLKTDDIFKYVTAAGKTSVYIEGDIKILNTSIEPTLNADQNRDKSTDSEVFEAAQKAIASKADYVFVHFHGVDDMGHTYGDINDPTMGKIKEIDQYIKDLVSGFKGRVIITADHGMHKTKEAGGHGEFRYEDMIIPYISFSQQ